MVHQRCEKMLENQTVADAVRGASLAVRTAGCNKAWRFGRSSPRALPAGCTETIISSSWGEGGTESQRKRIREIQPFLRRRR